MTWGVRTGYLQQDPPPLPSTTVSAAGNADTADVLMHKSEQLEQHLGAAESAGL